MARIRTIKPEFFTSDDITSRSPLARLFYVALWCEADRDGRLEWKPRTFKLRYLPADACNVEELAKELTDRGLIVVYTVDERNYAEIPTFMEHQVINNRESTSTIPPRVTHASRTRAPRVTHACTTRESGREGKGRERKGKEGVASGDAPTPDGVPDSVWQDFRKTRKTALTKTGLDGIRAEAVKAGMTLADALAMACRRGWQGFEAAWLQDLRAAPDGAAAVADPDSRASVEALGLARGIGKWDELKEPWPAYRKRVKGLAA